MSFSSRRRNYLLTPHRRDGLIEWMKAMLQHSFVLDALETTAADTFTHFEVLIEEHREMERIGSKQTSRLKHLVPTIGSFFTPLPLRQAFAIYNDKHRLTKRKHIQISFNELRHILNLAQILAMRKAAPVGQITAEYLSASKADGLLLQQVHSDDALSADDENENFHLQAGQLNGPKLISFDGDQTLYSDGANFEGNPKLANYLYLLLKHGVAIAVVTAAGYEYNVEKYEYRLSGLLEYFKKRGLTKDECSRFYLFGGECNYLVQLGSDYRLRPVKEEGPGGWCTATRYIDEAPANWPETSVSDMLDCAEESMKHAVDELNLRGRVIRKKRSIGLVPIPEQEITRESLDEVVLRVQEKFQQLNEGDGPALPWCAFNGGTDAWLDVGNKRVGVKVLQSYLGIPPEETLHIGDQFLGLGNDYAARAVCPCIWIINPAETTYILKSILRLSDVDVSMQIGGVDKEESDSDLNGKSLDRAESAINFDEMERRDQAAKKMDVYTGELVK